MTKTPEHADPVNDLPESFYISSVLRGNFDRNAERSFDEETSRAIGTHLANASVDSIGSVRSASMIRGYMRHQRQISMPDDADKNPAMWMKVEQGKLEDVSVSERSKDGRLVGKKVEVSFWSDYSDDDTPESISTGWIDFFGYGDCVFEVCLSRSVAAMAVVLRDMDVSFQVRKVLLDKTKNSKGKVIQPREMVDVSPVWDAERDAALLAQDIEALLIAIEDGVDDAIAFLKDEDLYDVYYERAFGVLPPE